MLRLMEFDEIAAVAARFRPDDDAVALFALSVVAQCERRHTAAMDALAARAETAERALNRAAAEIAALEIEIRALLDEAEHVPPDSLDVDHYVLYLSATEYSDLMAMTKRPA